MQFRTSGILVCWSLDHLAFCSFWKVGQRKEHIKVEQANEKARQLKAEQSRAMQHRAQSSNADQPIAS
jgi:hypothetical protein